MVPLLLPNFGSSLKWYQLCLWFFILFSNSPFLLQNFAVFSNGTFSVGTFLYKLGLNSLKWYLFASQFLSFSEMVPFLFLILSTCLEWYYFCLGGEILIILWNGTIIVADFRHFPGMVPFWRFCLWFLANSSIGTFLCSKIFALFSYGSIFCFRFFALCSNGTIFWFIKFFTLYSNGTFFVAELWNFSKMVPFLFVIFGTFF